MLLFPLPLVPLAGAALLALLGRRAGARVAAGIGCAAALGAFLLALRAVGALLSIPLADRVVDEVASPWIASGGFVAPFHFALDPLSAVMVLVVTGVGLLIHVYAAGYMSEDRSPGRFFAEMNLFLAFMLTLVLARNLLLLYVGWEGVGLCSYLLISFWYERPKAADAGLKAFLVNRVGDAGFLLGLVLLALWTGGGGGGTWSVGFPDLALRARDLGPAHAAIVGLLLFWGATAKSAQIPLYVWLPDAMEGPTPVSALIHAATMVTAGVYMTSRLNFLWAEAPWVGSVIAWVGGLTALWAALLALVERDLKRVLAYSTVSQLGYMFIGVGVGVPAAAIFHLTTHAFFKALLFLAAGSVMHGLEGETDLTQMGGLRRSMPWTAITFFVGALALAGVPLLSGFYSKDLILSSALAQGHPELWFLGLATAGLTAFYIFRAYVLAFEGEARTDRHAHESPPIMTAPLALLALGAILAGYLGFPRALGGSDAFAAFLTPLLGGAPEMGEGRELGLMALSGCVALAGVGFSFWVYLLRPEWTERVRRAVPTLSEMIEGKFYVDDFYQEAFVKPARSAAEISLGRLDLGILDRLVDFSGGIVRSAGGALRSLQGGEVQSYAAYIALGVLWLLWRATGR